MALAASSSSITDRMIRAAKLDVSAYEEVEADTNATTQAITVVVIAAVASGIAAAIGSVMLPAGVPRPNPIMGLIGGLLMALIGWAVWSGTIYLVGTKMMGGTATYGEVLRTIGFAQSPGILNILGFIPVVGGLIGLAVGIWTIVTGFIATRQALDIDNGKTIGTIVIALIAYIIVLAVLGGIFAAIGLGGAAMMGGLR